MEKVIGTPDLAESILITFNDKDPGFAQSLQTAISTLPGYEKVTHKPNVFCDSIDNHVEEIFANIKLVPTLSFIRPVARKWCMLAIRQGDWLNAP